MGVAGISLLAALGTGQAQVLLRLLDAGTGLSSLTITPGQSFSLNVQVSGLSSPALDNFDLQLAVLPMGTTISSFTDTVPTGWISLSDAPTRKYGAGNISGTDLTGTSTLVQINLTTIGTMATGSYTVSFVAQNSASQDLRGSSNQSIPYIPSSFTLTVVPEPTTGVLMLIGLGGLCWHLWRGRRRRADRCREQHRCANI